MGTLIQDKQQRNPDSQPRWNRLERADLFEQYRELPTRGISERQAAKEINVPERPCKPGAYGMTPWIFVPTSPHLFKAVPDLLAYTES